MMDMERETEWEGMGRGGGGTVREGWGTDGKVKRKIMERKGRERKKKYEAEVIARDEGY